MPLIRLIHAVAICALSASLVGGCDTPHTKVVLDNHYPFSSALVIFQGQWSIASFTTPVPPGTSSDPQDAVPASANTAYVVLAPGFDPSLDGGATPTSFVVLQSIGGFEVHLDNTLHIPVDDTTFAGNCASGSFLTQDKADFITQRVFQNVFTGLTYHAATCTTTAGP